MQVGGVHKEGCHDINRLILLLSLGLAILNPSAQVQVKQYARSVYELFTMMIQEDEVAFRERVTKVEEGQ